MVHRVEEFGDVALHQPARAGPGGLDLSKRCMASSLRTEPMGMLTHLRLVVGFQNGAHDFLQQLVFPRGQPQRSLTSFYGKIKSGPLDTGPEQAVHLLYGTV